MSQDGVSVIRTMPASEGALTAAANAPVGEHAEGTERTVDLQHPSLYINRELSWLAFNERVLDQAKGEHHPLLERVKFLAITANNLDEFFMVRIATLARQLRAGQDAAAPDGLTVSEQLPLVRERAVAMLSDIGACWEERLRPALEEEDIRVLEPADYTRGVRAYLTRYFSEQVSPVLTPLAFDPGHPFPYISNRSKSFAIAVESQGRTRFARVKVPQVLPRFVPMPPQICRQAGHTFAFLEDVIRLGLPELFPGLDLVSAHLFRVIRETDIVLAEDESADLLEAVDEGLKRVRHGPLVLLEVDSTMPPRVLEILADNFEIAQNVVVKDPSRLAFSDWMALVSIERPKLKDPPFVPRRVWHVQEPETVFEDIRHADTFVHHPFDSFGAVETFLDAAVNDDHVVAIKMTLYRIGHRSPIVEQLIDAVEAGKQVVVLVELKARFDERSNIGWATRLEEAGVHVVYGLVNLKTHCKLCLVVRKEKQGIQRYVHVGTGNYNRATASIYTDLGLFTAHPDIAADVSELFNYLTGYSQQTEYRKLLVAPVLLRGRFARLIKREIEHHRAGRPAGIIIKNNAVSDDRMIRVLYRASQAGVPIRAIVRGICCLRPGMRGVSGTIQVRSIVGRFLEHSRVYYFENGGDSEVYFGSADLMERNLDRRVEVLCPVLDPAITQTIRQTLLEPYLQDTARASILQSDGTYRPETPSVDGKSYDAQKMLLQRSRAV